MLIRLFTSGKHNGLDFSNDDISSIAEKSAKNSPDKIPIVLGHPDNDLPVVGWLHKSKIKSYNEDGKFSLGFERSDADLSEPSLKVIRDNGANKISIRLKNGAISHIGLVENAAVKENNEQNFEAADIILNGTADFNSSSETDVSSDALKSITDFFSKLKSSFKQPDKKDEKEETVKLTELKTGMTPEMTAQFAEMQKMLETVTKQNEQNANKLKYTQMFSAKEYRFSAEVLEKAATIASKLSDADALVFAEIIKSSSKPTVPPSGSIVSQFGANGGEDNVDGLGSEIDKQISGL